ncbi:MAG: hypothetical protein AAB320_07705 [Elusimicrobiota bacterium]
MKPLFLIVLLAVSASATPFTEFESRVTASALKPFALDMGGVLGGLSLWNGRSLGFPGFEAGVMGAAQNRPDRDALVLRNSGVGTFGLPVAHAAVGLPLKFDLVLHGFSIDRVTLIGGGIRYGIFKSGLLTKWLPNVGVSAFGDSAEHPSFRLLHGSLNAAAGWDLPFVQPFVGAGVDSTQAKIKAAAVPGALGAKATATGTRLNAGIDVTPFPFLRLRLAAMLLHGLPGFSTGLFVKF